MTIGQIISALLLKAAEDSAAREAMKRDLFALMYGADEVQKQEQQDPLAHAEALLKQYEKERQLLHELWGVTCTATGRMTSSTPQVQEFPPCMPQFPTSLPKTVSEAKAELAEKLAKAGLDDCEVVQLGPDVLGVNVGSNLPPGMTVADKIAVLQKIVNEVGTEPAKQSETEPETKTKAMPDVYQQDAALARLVRKKFTDQLVSGVITITYNEFQAALKGK